ncbi:MAG: dipeptidyl carboxypeptidase II, partial [Pseudomonadota bacterium]
MKTLIATAISSALLLSACSEPSNTTTNKTAQNEQVSASIESTNPLFVRSTLQYQTPNFNAIKDEHFIPAFEKGMQEQLAEIEAIANNSAAPTFENTIVAMEKSGELLTRTSRIFFNLNGTDSNEARRAIQSEMAPKLAAHGDNINLNATLFSRIETIYNQRATLNLTGEETRLVEVIYKGFVHAGAKLNEEQKTRIREINKELSTLGTQFGQNLMALTKSNVIIVEDKA